MALAHGILPSQLMAEPDDVIMTMADIFEARHQQAQAAKRKAAASSRNSPGRSARRKGH